MGERRTDDRSPKTFIDLLGYSPFSFAGLQKYSVLCPLKSLKLLLLPQRSDSVSARGMLFVAGRW